MISGFAFCKRDLFYDLQNTCTISFSANHTISGIYAVAVSVEDFPKSTINIGSTIYTPSNKLSTVSLQVIYELIEIKMNDIFIFILWEIKRVYVIFVKEYNKTLLALVNFSISVYITWVFCRNKIIVFKMLNTGLERNIS